MADQEFQGGEDQSETLEVDEAQFPLKRQNNTLPLYGNKETMNINSMILTNIKQSPYFKTDLFKLKTFHEVVDEIFYRVRFSMRTTFLAYNTRVIGRLCVGRV